MTALAAELLLAVAAVAIALTCVGVSWHLRVRDFHPALPPMLRIAQSTAELLVPQLAAWLSRPMLQALRERLDRDLRLAGLAPRLRGIDWLVILAGVVTVVGSLLGFAWVTARVAGIHPPGLMTFLLGSCCGVLLTQQWLQRVARDRESGLLRELPAGLELLSLSLECGCALLPALEIASRHLPAGALRQILRSLHADLSAGRSRSAALRRLFDLNQGSVVAPTLGALVQAEAAGSSLAPVLRAQARQRSEERFSAAEKAALQAPVKMLLPLICCIFPCTFIVIAFPLVTRFLQ